MTSSEGKEMYSKISKLGSGVRASQNTWTCLKFEFGFESNGNGRNATCWRIALKILYTSEGGGGGKIKNSAQIPVRRNKMTHSMIQRLKLKNCFRNAQEGDKGANEKINFEWKSSKKKWLYSDPSLACTWTCWCMMKCLKLGYCFKNGHGERREVKCKIQLQMSV